MRRATLARLAVFVATTMAAWAVLAYGTGDDDGTTLQVGQIAQRDYTVVVSRDVTDVEAFFAAQEAARNSVEPVSVLREGIDEEVIESIEEFMAGVAAAVVVTPSGPTTSSTRPVETTTTTSSTTTTTLAGDDTTDTTQPPPTTIPPEEVQVLGMLFIDADGNGEFNAEGAEGAGSAELVDAGLPAVTINVTSPTRRARAETQLDGTFAATVTEGEVTVTVDTTDPDFPGFEISAGAISQTAECSGGGVCEFEPVGFAPNLIPTEVAVASISPQTLVPEASVQTLVEIARGDVVRVAAGGQPYLADVQEAAIVRAQSLFGQQIFETDADRGISLEEAKILATTQPPLVFFPSSGRDAAAGQAAGDVVANFLLANWAFDDAATAEAAEERAQEVAEREDDFKESFVAGMTIAREGEQLTQLQIDAIQQTGGVFERAQRSGGLLAVLTVLSAVLALYLNRFRPEFWAKPRMVALLGILIVLGAASVRMAMALQDYSWYILPAVVFGLMTTVLFDARIGVLMSLAMAILAAVGTRDPGVTVYALLASIAPIPFISAVSSRRAFRNAAVMASGAAAVIAAATSWLFHTGPQDDALVVIGTSMAWAFGVSLSAALIGLAALQFFESAFDITTTLALLDLTDRNHEALQLLQEKAFGTFNHSLMVGTLADAAARAIGADPLLARASAYYHDLGKTENPTMFIENQFGIANPHDEMTPEESAEIVRRHVTDGIHLAKRFNIPSEVAEAIVSHHGDAIMRYFYEKARQTNPDVDPAAFRHVGHKPRTAETAIVMLADSLEASCRAVFQTEEPTPQAIEKVVTRVIDEKVNDGQLSESPVTLAQLTQMRKAFLGSLVGHYHQRIAYPNFPGS